MAVRALFLALLAGATLPALAQEAPAPELFRRADKGHCIACHQLPAGAGPPTRSDLGPALAGARMRELGKAKLRELIQDPTRANPATVMPPYGRHHILDAAEIGRLADYLHALP
jgi:sulfur-oxidizing protein SoxX